MKIEPIVSCFAASLFTYLASSYEGMCGGLTAITHGQGGNTDGWVSYMATRMDEYDSFPGSKASFYRITVIATNGGYTASWTFLGGNPSLPSDSGEIVALLDWRTLANSSHSTKEIAPVFTDALLSQNFIEKLNGHALAELPIHVIGHSRGGSLMAEITRGLGTNGVWVDHQTTLDGYALGSANDAAITNTYENVLFHDNYWQNFIFSVHGSRINGAYNRYLSSLPGGYWPDFTGNHADVHLWYHGTIDLRTPTDDGSAPIYDIPERYLWWKLYEQKGTNAGFLYSLIGRGDRTLTNRPAGGSSDAIRAGFNQRFDVGIGTAGGSRTLLPPLLDAWPNPIRFDIVGATNVVSGELSQASLYYQWAPADSEPATETYCLDPDANAWNSNELFLGSWSLPATGTGSVGHHARDFAVTASPGSYRLLAMLSGNGKTRYLYAPQLITVVGTVPLRVDIAKADSDLVGIGVYGTVGQSIALEWSSDLMTWVPLSTNVLRNQRWSYFESLGTGSRFYRAKRQ